MNDYIINFAMSLNLNKEAILYFEGMDISSDI